MRHTILYVPPVHTTIYYDNAHQTTSALGPDAECLLILHIGNHVSQQLYTNSANNVVKSKTIL